MKRIPRSGILETSKVPELGNKFQFFYESRCFAGVFTGSLQLTWPHGSNPRSYISIKISFNILLPYTPRFPKWSLLFLVLRPKLHKYLTSLSLLLERLYVPPLPFPWFD